MDLTFWDSLKNLLGNDYIEIISIVLTFLTVMATLGMAAATWRMAVATKRMAQATQDTLESLSKPNVIVYVIQRVDAPTMLQIIIENNGTAPAYDITFTIPDYFPTAMHITDRTDNRLPNMGKEELLRAGIKYLAPGARRILNWGMYLDLKNSIGDTQFDIKAFFGRKHNDSEMASTISIITLHDFFNAPTHDSPEVRQAKSLKVLADKVTSIDTRHNKYVNHMEQLLGGIAKLADAHKTQEAHNCRQALESKNDIEHTITAGESPLEPSLQDCGKKSFVSFFKRLVNK